MSIYQQLAGLIRRDPARRGLAQSPALAHYGDGAALQRAAASLAAEGAAVALVTGFPILVGGHPMAETDGPPGAAMLASVLWALGHEIWLISDAVGRPALAVACEVCGIPQSAILEMPLTQSGAGPPAGSLQPNEWAQRFMGGAGGARPTHLVAIERPGPTHTEVSLLQPARGGSPPFDRFRAALPADLRDRALNMRGEAITSYIAPTHLLFEMAGNRDTRAFTVGIGDGGNEIGMGAVPWELLDDALGLPGSGRIACRIATDELVIAGVSNWGGYALAAAVAYASGNVQVFDPCTVARERRLIESLVRDAGAVDGVTRERVPSVDGLPLETHLDLLAEIRALFHLQP
ncbi:MAG: DUF4392 domain-containing protein [Pirellulales bacterium]|nr:DUF4392 domain-containing protein [Pirellulales bacterium]